MKKIIILLVFFFNILPCLEKGKIQVMGVEGTTAQSAKQFSTCNTPGSGGGGGGGSTISISGILSDIGQGVVDAIQAIGGFFSDLFASDDSGIEDGGGGESFSGGDGGGGGDDGDDGGGDSGDDGGDDDSGDDDVPVTEYVGAVNSSSQTVDTTRKDTLQPKRVNCDSTANANGQKLTAILDSVEHTPQMRDLRANAQKRKYEAGLSIYKFPFNPDSTYQVSDYDTSGTTNNVSIGYTNWSVATVHVHPLKDSTGNFNVDGQSPVDFFSVLNMWKIFLKHRFQTSYVISARGTEYAVTITDTNLVKTFLARNTRSSILNDTGKYKNNWAGDEFVEKSLYGQYFNAYNNFISEGYAKDYAEDYANVYMIDNLNMGIKMYKKESGQFKELNTSVITDSTGKDHYKVKECQ